MTKESRIKMLGPDQMPTGSHVLCVNPKNRFYEQIGVVVSSNPFRIHWIETNISTTEIRSDVRKLV